MSDAERQLAIQQLSLRIVRELDKLRTAVAPYTVMQPPDSTYTESVSRILNDLEFSPERLSADAALRVAESVARLQDLVTYDDAPRTGYNAKWVSPNYVIHGEPLSEKP